MYTYKRLSNILAMLFVLGLTSSNHAHPRSYWKWSAQRGLFVIIINHMSHRIFSAESRCQGPKLNNSLMLVMIILVIVIVIVMIIIIMIIVIIIMIIIIMQLLLLLLLIIIIIIIMIWT